MEWTTQGKPVSIRVVGRYLIPIEITSSDQSISRDKAGKVKGVWIKGEFEILRPNPHEFVVDKTLVYGHVTRVRNRIETIDEVHTILAVRLSEEADKLLTN